MRFKSIKQKGMLEILTFDRLMGKIPAGVA